MNKKEVTVIEMELKVRKDRARDVIRNAKEIVSVGLHGKEIKRLLPWFRFPLSRWITNLIRGMKRDIL